MQTAAPANAIAAIKAELIARGVTVEVEGSELRCKGPAGALTPELREAVRTHKGDLLIALTGYVPLDRAIITSTATRKSIEQMHERLVHAQQEAAKPDATPLHQQVVRDWTAILRAKERTLTQPAPTDGAADPYPSIDDQSRHCATAIGATLHAR